MRLAHVSDLHLLSLEGASLRDFLNKRWTGGMNLLLHRGRHYRAEIFEALVACLNAERVDHVICTGDVTNLALASEFAFARALFDKLEVGPEHVTCVPGNHDAYVADAATRFEEAFAPYCAPDPGWGWTDGGRSRWPVVRVRGQVALVALSTSRPTPWFMAHGSVGPAQLARLERALSDPRLQDKCRIVLLHHPPAGPRAQSRVRGLRDHAALSEVLGRVGAELVVHGHEHLPIRESLAGPGGVEIPVRGVESGSYDGEKPHRTARFRVYEVRRRPSGRPVVVEEPARVWNARVGEFVVETAGRAME